MYFPSYFSFERPLNKSLLRKSKCKQTVWQKRFSKPDYGFPFKIKRNWRVATIQDTTLFPLTPTHTFPKPSTVTLSHCDMNFIYHTFFIPVSHFVSSTTIQSVTYHTVPACALFYMTTSFSNLSQHFLSLTPTLLSISSSLPYLNHFSPSPSPVLHFTNLPAASSYMNHQLNFFFPFLFIPVCSIPTLILHFPPLLLHTFIGFCLLHLPSLTPPSPYMARREAGGRAYFSEEALSVDCSPG